MMRTSLLAERPLPAGTAPLPTPPRAALGVAHWPDDAAAAAHRCSFRQGYIAAIGALEVLLRMRGEPPALAFERAVTFADGALAEWQLAAGPGGDPPPRLVSSPYAHHAER
jgi:hypothetical protein